MKYNHAFMIYNSTLNLSVVPRARPSGFCCGEFGGFPPLIPIELVPPFTKLLVEAHNVLTVHMVVLYMRYFKTKFKFIIPL